MTRRVVALALAPLAVLSCSPTAPPAEAPPVAPVVAPAPEDGEEPVTPPKYSRLGREDLNRLAVRANLPLYWAEDANHDGAVDPGEVHELLFYPPAARWAERGAFTPAFVAAYQGLLDAAQAGAPSEPRERLVLEDLDQGRATLVRSDLSGLDAAEQAFVARILEATAIIDELYDVQTGAAALAPSVPRDDAASQSLFRRNRGPKCRAPKTEGNPECSAIPGAPKPVVDVYPASVQTAPDFCAALEKRPDAKTLLTPFTVVREEGERLVAVPYSKAYAGPMGRVASALDAAARALTTPSEGALRSYLAAAAGSFRSGDWGPADEAWAKMTATNSKWYLRVAPDETYWDPCSHKAGFHLTFARINQASLAWQEKLTPHRKDMEESLAKLVGAPYRARPVTFHLPDFIDIVWNAGDDRQAFGATIGQSLPNWGKVASEGRGRTVAMSNLFTDPDSRAMRREQAASLLDAEAMRLFSDEPLPGLLDTILHEATHNLGPAHEYKYRGKTADQAFGGELASMLEELKAQTGALYFLEFAKARGLISPELAAQAYVDSFVWAFGHISRGMTTPDGHRRPYSQLAAIQLGALIDEGALTWDQKRLAANGRDQGAFSVEPARFSAAAEKLMKTVATIKAKNDRAAAEALAKQYVEGDAVPMATIAERYLRFPKASLVYAVDR